MSIARITSACSLDNSVKGDRSGIASTGTPKIAAICSFVILSGCATPIPPPPVTVSVPVPVSCIKSTPQRPSIHTDADLALLDDYKFTLAIFTDRRALIDYTAELEAILGACR